MGFYAKNVCLGCLIFTVYVWAAWLFNLSMFSLTEAVGVESTYNLYELSEPVCFTFYRKPTSRVNLPPPLPTQPLLILLSNHASSTRPERTVPHQIKHVMGPRKYPGREVKWGHSSAAEALSCSSSSGSDYHVRLSDVSRPWNVINVAFSLWGFGSGIWTWNQRHSIFYWEFGKSVSSVGNGSA